MENKAKTIEVIYTIKPQTGAWPPNTIESNIKEEELVDWKISKSLSDELIEKSATLRPEQLLLQYAEMQRRGLEMSIEGLEDLELRMQASTNRITESLDAILLEQQNVWDKKAADIEEAKNKFKEKMTKTASEFTKVGEPLSALASMVESLSSWQMEHFLTGVTQIGKLQRDYPNLLKFVVENFKKPE